MLAFTFSVIPEILQQKFLQYHMTSPLPDNNKTCSMQCFYNFHSRNNGKFHITISSIFIFLSRNSINSSSSGSRYNSMASFIFFNASSIVSPWEMHPGKEGTYTVYPPSSCGSMTTFNLIFIYWERIDKGFYFIKAVCVYSFRVFHL